MKYPAPLVSQLLFAGVVFEILLLDPVLRSLVKARPMT